MYESILKNIEEVMEIAGRVYKLGKAKSYKKLNKGFGSLKYDVQFPRGRYCLRINLPFFSSNATAELRGEVLHKLSPELTIARPERISVCASNDYIAKRGKTYFSFDSYCLELYPWLQKIKNAGPSNRILSEFELLESSLMGISTSFHNPKTELIRMKKLDLLKFIEIKEVAHLYNEEELRTLQTSYEENQNLINSLRNYLLEHPKKLIHGDCHLSNFAYGTNNQVIIFDFESLRFGHTLEDISWFLEDYLFRTPPAKRPDKLERIIASLDSKGISEGINPPLIYSYLLYRRLRSYNFHLESNFNSEKTPKEVIEKHRNRLKFIIQNRELFI